MVITVEEARKLIGRNADKYTDDQLIEVINSFELLADMAIDTWLAKTPEERKRISEELKKKNLPQKMSVK